MELLKEHFSMYQNTEDHICFCTFKRLFEEIEARGCPPLTILETGTAYAGTKSTYLFDSYVKKYGGHFWSVDICGNTCDEARKNVSSSSTIVCDDSVHFLETWVKEHPGQKADVVYLDSFDLEWDNPFPAADHGLKEYFAILPALGKGSLLLIDDTPNTCDELLEADHKMFLQVKKSEQKCNKPLVGKGMYIPEHCKAECIRHVYQLLYLF
jgi:hypothetical protein